MTERIPLLATLTTTLEELDARAAAVSSALADGLDDVLSVSIEASQCQLGSGALPDQHIPSRAVAVSGPRRAIEKLSAKLRRLPIPVISRRQSGRLWLDMRCAEPLDELIASLKTLST